MILILVMLKILASILLIAFLIAGIFKANPRTHNLSYGHTAEYLAGFIVFMIGITGLYNLWI